jgi:mono/diheme cytochrome c family protein
VKKIRTLFAIGLVLAILSGAAFATVAWQKVFNNLYKPSAGTDIAKAKCQICHTQKTGGPLNPYGKALNGKKADAASLKSVEQLDSDKDGKTNIQEIKAGTLPGDAKSK